MADANLWGHTSVCEANPYLWGNESFCEFRPQSVKMCSSSVRPSLNMLGQASLCEAIPHCMRPGLILGGHPDYVRPGLFLWGQTSFFEARPYFVRSHLILWGQSSFFESRPDYIRPGHTLWGQTFPLRPDLNLWGQSSICEAINLWGWPHPHSLSVSLIIKKNSHRISNYRPRKSVSSI